MGAATHSVRADSHWTPARRSALARQSPRGVGLSQSPQPPTPTPSPQKMLGIIIRYKGMISDGLGVTSRSAASRRSASRRARSSRSRRGRSH